MVGPDRGRAFRARSSAQRIGLAAMLAMALAATTSGPAVATEPPSGTDVPARADRPVAVSDSVARTDRVVIRWRAEAGGREPGTAEAAAPDRVARLSRAAGLPVRFVRIAGTGASVYRLGSRLGQDADRILAALGRVPGVKYVEPDYIMTADVLPNDTQAADLWGLTTPGDAGASGSPFGIDATGAWTTAPGPGRKGQGIVVAVIDTGILRGAAEHEDLVGQTVPGYDFIDDVEAANDGTGRDNDPADPGDWCGEGDESSWHGSHVAGTIAAVANNNLGVFGGAPLAKILPVRVLGTCGGNATDIRDGIIWAAGAPGTSAGVNPNPARILNLSLGGTRVCSAEDQAAVDAARAQGAVVIVSAGNSNRPAGTAAPANCNGVITVAATDINGKKADFSNFGPLVEIAGPGVSVLSTINSGNEGPVSTMTGGSVYEPYDGTSMAAPHVAAAAALVAQAYPTLGPDGIASLLMNSATPFAADATTNSCGARGCGPGIADAKAAIDALAGAAPSVGTIVAPAAVKPGTTFTVTARTVDVQNVASAAITVAGGAPAGMTAADGAFGEKDEIVTKAVSMPAGADGPVAVCVSATDGAVNASAPVCATVIRDNTGSVAGNPTVTDEGSIPGRVTSITSLIGDAQSGVAGASHSIDGGAPVPMLPVDGAFNTNSETAGSFLGGSATALSLGSWHGCAVLQDGTIRCWGNNADNQLVANTPDGFATIPVDTGWSGATVVAGGGYHTCAIIGGGRVQCVGYGLDGQLGHGVFGSSATPVTVSGLTDAIALAAGKFHTCALRANGTVRCWGYNGTAALGNGSKLSRSSPVSVSGLSGVKKIAAGGYHSCALLTSGAIKCWGWRGWGELGDGTSSGTTPRLTPVTVKNITTAVDITAGEYHTCAVLKDRSARCWGKNETGQNGTGNFLWRTTPGVVAGLTGATGISAGDDHTCAVQLGGAVRCWGANFRNQVDGSAVPVRPTSTAVTGLPSGVTAVSAGAATTCARTTGGAVHCWGLDDIGEAGDGALPESASLSQFPPSQVLGLGGALAVGPHQLQVQGIDLATNAGAKAPTPATVNQVTGTLAANLRTGPIGAGATSALPIALTWNAGVVGAMHQLNEKVGGAVAFSPVGLAAPLATALDAVQPQSTRIQYQVRGVVGPATGPWITMPAFALFARQNSSSSVLFTGTGWTSRTTASAFGGNTRVSSAAGARASTTFIGTSVAWVATRAKTQGKAAVYIDGALRATIDLYSPTTRYRQVVFTASNLSRGAHTITVKVLGTKRAAATGKRVDIDAFLVLSPAP